MAFQIFRVVAILLLLFVAVALAARVPAQVDSVPPAATDASSDCVSGKVVQKIAVTLTPPEGSDISTVAFDITYDAARVAIPGERDAESVKQRVQGFPAGAITAVNDKNGEVRVVLAGTKPLPVAEEPVFFVSFDVCQGAEPPVVSDYACVASGCVAMTVPVEGCTCAVAIAAAEPGGAA